MAATANRIKGKAKQIEGRLTGDKLREAEGMVQAAAGKAAAAVKRGVRKAKGRIGMSGRGRAKAKTGRKASAARAAT